LDFVIKGALKLAGPLIKGIKGIGAKVKAKVLGGDDSPEGKKKRLDKGMAAGVSAANRFAGRKVGEKVLKPVLGLLGKRYGLAVLEPVKQDEHWAVHGEVQRATQSTGAKAEKDIDWSKAPATSLSRRGLSRDEIRHVFDQPTVDKAKSAIMESILAKMKSGGTAPKKAGKGATSQPKSDPTPKAEFIAGRRINMGGAEFSDGILGILGASDTKTPVVRVLKIFEAKGGERPKYKISSENDRYSRMPTTRDQRTGENEKDRLRREVVDQLIRENYPEALDESLTPEQSRNAHQAAKAKVLKTHKRKLERLMAASYRERTTGQAVRNRERLSPDVDLKTGKDIPAVLTIDGVPRQVVGYSPNSTLTVVVLPSDIAPGTAMPAQLKEQGITATFENVPISSKDLSTLASAVMKAKS
jgi:hypothetical protein